MLEKLDCFFVGDRPYIQGSQIIAKCVAALHTLYEGTEIVLQEAKFVQITENEVFISDTTNDKMDVIGQLELSINESDTVIYINTNKIKVNRRSIESTTFDYSFSEKDQLNGLIEFNTDHANFESLLCVLIAANKKLHNDLSDSTHDIWFTGLRKASIYTSSNKLPSRGSINFKHLMTAGKGSHQTISEVSILDATEKNNLPQFIISFAYKS